MKSFSLRAALLFVAASALLVSHVRTSMQLREAKQEIDVIRRTYGYMKIQDGTKINVISLAQEKRSGGDALRFVVPPGERYFLNLSETTAEKISELPSGRHKTTVSLGWADGKDIILRYGLFIDPEKQTPYLEVGSRNQRYFTYRPDDWPSNVNLHTVSQLDASDQTEIVTREPIVLIRASSESINRGIILWLEPESHRTAQRERNKS